MPLVDEPEILLNDAMFVITLPLGDSNTTLPWSKPERLSVISAVTVTVSLAAVVLTLDGEIARLPSNGASVSALLDTLTVAGKPLPSSCAADRLASLPTLSRRLASRTFHVPDWMNWLKVTVAWYMPSVSVPETLLNSALVVTCLPFGDSNCTAALATPDRSSVMCADTVTVWLEEATLTEF